MTGGLTGQTLIGTPGDDDLTGTPGNDLLDGRAGRDTLKGLGGDDVLVYSADGQWQGHDAVTNAGSPGVRGTENRESLAGHSRTRDTYDGGVGQDVLVGSGGHDAILLDTGEPAPKLRDIEVIVAGDGNDIVDLTSKRFSYGDVAIEGGEGNDVLWSSAGDDLLAGGRGNDQLAGGAGSDIYLHELQGGHDVIEDTGGGADTLQFGAGIAPGMVHMERRGQDLVLDLAGPHGSVTIKDWFASNGKRIERIQFVDGTIWTEEVVRNAVRTGAEGCDTPRHDDRHREDHHRHGHHHDEDKPEKRRVDRRDDFDKWFSEHLSRAPRFEFQKLLESSASHGPALSAGEIAQAWARVRRYTESLGADGMDGGTELLGAPLKPLVPTGAIAWGFEGSTGASKAFETFHALEGLKEGFRRL